MINGIAYVGIRGIGTPPTNFDWHNLTNPARNPNYPSGVACGIAVDEHSNGANIEVSTTTGQVWETFCEVDNPTPSLNCGTAVMGQQHPWVLITPGPMTAPMLNMAAKNQPFKSPPAKKPAVKNQAAKKPAANHTVNKGNKQRP
ncbi:hypothetical protein [Streptomyces sp. ISL-43]|uniref:hypothetical protein n=1 Tax=Streptomyces sp. ISL-43 TaxID=2819183 RepID=UPI001BED3710|nr:hypothetical protein [Streptomyces sp. ISL-43]